MTPDQDLEHDPLEIERVFLLDRMPEVPDQSLSTAERWEIEQGYLSSSESVPGHDTPEGRLRRITHADGSVEMTHTVKKGLGLVRTERERALDASEFEDLWPATSGRRIRKIRLRIDVAGQIWEIDQFSDLPLVLAEAELSSVETVLPIPEWLQPRIIREVTEEGAFRNFNLASRKGFLEPDSP